MSMETWVEATGTRDSYEYVFWDGDSIQDLLHTTRFPRIGTLYESVPTNLYGIRADLARLVILFHFGGLYADADTRVLNPEPLLDYFESALRHGHHDAVLGVADLNGCTRRWIQATRRPSNFLMACPRASAFIATYLDSIADDFETSRIGDELRKADRWSRNDHLRVTRTWTGPKKLRALLKSESTRSCRIRLTPIGFVASAHQDCFADAVLAHDYKSNWYPKSKSWKRIRDTSLYWFLRTPLDAWIILLLVSLLSLAIAKAWPSGADSSGDAASPPSQPEYFPGRLPLSYDGGEPGPTPV